MEENNTKEGPSVKEIEEFAKSNGKAIFFSLTLFCACLFSKVLWSQWWSILFVTAGGVAGAFYAQEAKRYMQAVTQFVFKQERPTQITLGAVALFSAIFLPPLIFFILGLGGGATIYPLLTNRQDSPASEEILDQ